MENLLHGIQYTYAIRFLKSNSIDDLLFEIEWCNETIEGIKSSDNKHEESDKLKFIKYFKFIRDMSAVRLMELGYKNAELLEVLNKNIT